MLAFVGLFEPTSLALASLMSARHKTSDIAIAIAFTLILGSTSSPHLPHAQHYCYQLNLTPSELNVFPIVSL